MRGTNCRFDLLPDALKQYTTSCRSQAPIIRSKASEVLARQRCQTPPRDPQSVSSLSSANSLRIIEAREQRGIPGSSVLVCLTGNAGAQYSPMRNAGSNPSVTTFELEPNDRVNPTLWGLIVGLFPMMVEVIARVTS